MTKEINFCTYKINTEPNTVISLYVADFDLKDSTLDDKGCAYTFLVVRKVFKDLYFSFGINS